MKSIPEVPQSVITESETNPKILWEWISQQYYAELLSQSADEWLVRLRQRFVLDKLAAVCQAYHVYSGQRGQEATHTIICLCWALLLKHLFGWSYRQTSREIRSNNLARWFVGYQMHESSMSYVTLQRFAVWVCAEHPRLFFTEILQQIDQDFPEEAQKPQVGDTFAVLANVAGQSRTALLRDACRRLLHYWQQVSPPGYAAVMAQLNREALFGAASDLPGYQLDATQRDALEIRTALAADDCLRLVQQPLAALPENRRIEFLALKKWQQLLAKVLGDNFVFVRSPEGVASSARPCNKDERGTFLIGSTVDPEATFRKHGDHNDFGFNAQVAATDHFVREIFAMTGASGDASGVASLVAHQLSHLGLVPPKLIYDRAAGHPKIFHEVDKASHGQTQLVARLIDHNKNSARFGPLDFTLNQDGSLTCPNQQTSTQFYRSKTADGSSYRFSAQQCQDCPLRQRCRGEEPHGAETSPTPPAQPLPPATQTPLPPTDSTKPRKPRTVKPTAYRQVFISDYRDRQRTAILYTTTEAFKADMKLRPGIERTIAALVRYYDARQAHAIGLAKADFQVRMAALAFNCKRWLKFTLEKEKATGYRQPDSG